MLCTTPHNVNVPIAHNAATEHPGNCPTCFAVGRKLGVSLALQPLCTGVASEGICIFATPSAISELLRIGCRRLDYDLLNAVASGAVPGKQIMACPLGYLRSCAVRRHGVWLRRLHVTRFQLHSSMSCMLTNSLGHHVVMVL